MKITFIADTHHYSTTLGTSGEAYELRSGSDQKCLAETGAIIDAAFSQIAASDTQAVFIAGDVSNDGEKVSHLEFREKLYVLQKSKPVYLITSTHDWCCDENPRRFEGSNTYHDVPIMTSEELPDFYRDFGPAQAINHFITPIGTICYTIALSNKVRVLCLNDDKNEYWHAGFTEPCFEWIEQQIRQAQEDGCLMLGMMHHLLMPHASRLIATGSTCVSNREYVASRLADAGLRYMFVGHSHLQATDSYKSPSGNSITEINIGSLCGYPAPIVEVTTNDDGTITYEVKHLKEFSLEGKPVDAQIFLKKHAQDLIGRVLECRDKETFEKRLLALGIHIKNINLLFPVIKPILKWLDTSLVGDAYKLLRRLGLSNGISKDEVRPYYYKPIREMIFEMFFNLLDGQQVCYSENDTYYKMVMAVFTIPAKIMPHNEDCQELICLGKYLLTGGEINNQYATL